MTLIELLLVLTILSVLTAIAYPSYSDHVRQSHRQRALADLVRIQLQLELDYDGRYQWQQLVSGGICSICESSSQRFQFAVTSSATVAYTITATAQTDLGQDLDSCLTASKQIQLMANNQRIPTACWP